MTELRTLSNGDFILFDGEEFVVFGNPYQGVGGEWFVDITKEWEDFPFTLEACHEQWIELVEEY